ncbi:MAG: acyltransferase, partial [Pseudomonas sp. PGPPP3]
MSASPKPGAAYRPELDGLRAIAVVPVIVFHADAALFPAGYLGVDVFFLISGYLITRILLAELAQQRWSISAFYARRAQRILPALLAVIALSLPAAILILPPDDLKFMGHSLAWLGGLGANIFFW